MRECREYKYTHGEACDTIYYQGNGNSQTQILKYTGSGAIKASTGEFMWSDGRNNLKPIDIIYKPHIGPEIADIDLNPFDCDPEVPFNSLTTYLNPIKLIGSAVTFVSGWRNGFHFSPAMNPTGESVKFHTPILSQVSIGQETDIKSHRQKYDSWRALPENSRSKQVICMGVSRGTAATFCAITEMKPEEQKDIKLVVLEGAIDSVSAILPQRAINLFKYKAAANVATSVVKERTIIIYSL